MHKPTWNEVLEAVGYSLGRLRAKLEMVLALLPWLLSWAAVLIGAWHLLPMAYLAAVELPAPPPAVIFGMFGFGFMFFGAAFFCYVLFAFLSRLTRAEPSISRDVAHMIKKLAHPLVTAAAPLTKKPAEAETGSFHGIDDERAYYQEQFEALQRDGLLEGVDLEDLLKEGHTADIEFIDKSRAVGG